MAWAEKNVVSLAPVLTRLDIGACVLVKNPRGPRLQSMGGRFSWKINSWRGGTGEGNGINRFIELAFVDRMLYRRTRLGTGLVTESFCGITLNPIRDVR
jgi:hypothetical protein